MSIPHENVFILTKSLFCLNHPVLMFMGSKEQTPFCNHSFPPEGAWVLMLPALLSVTSVRNGLSAPPSLHDNSKDRRASCSNIYLPGLLPQLRFTGYACHSDPAGSITDLLPG